MPLLTSVASLAGLGLVPAGDFESIATVTVGSGGASSISFSSIPSTYQHLQVRAIKRNTSAFSGLAPLRFNLNNDTTSANYARHTLGGSGVSAYAQGGGSSPFFGIGDVEGNSLAGVFSPSIIDIIDYAASGKNRVMRVFSGGDLNGSGTVAVESMLWINTSIVSTITLTPWGGNWAQHSTFALYGIKA